MGTNRYESTHTETNIDIYSMNMRKYMIGANKLMYDVYVRIS